MIIKSSLIFILALVVLAGLFFNFYPVRNLSNGVLVQAAGITATVTIFYAKKTCENIDTTQSFTETLLNPNDSSLDIDLPADVLSSGEGVEMTMYSVFEETVTTDKPLPSGKLGADIFYNISFKKVSDNSTVSSFDKTVTLTFYYTDSDISGIDESALAAYRWNGSEWVILGDNIVDVSLNKVTASTLAFSLFGIFGEEEEEEEEEEPPPSGGGGGGGTLSTITTKIILQGKASPASYLTVLKDGQILVDSQADSQADFKVEISNITPGVYTFSIWAKDKNNIKSLTFSFTMNVISGAITTVSGIFLPPTINLSEDSVKKGETLNISGQTTPQSQVEIHISSDEIIEKVTADSSGAWLYNLNTGRLEEGTHSVRAKATTPDGLLSTFSQTLLFGVGRVLGIIKEADANNDNQVNLIDFSILLYNWGIPKNPAADLNNDGQVDLIDFSILLYWWTG